MSGASTARSERSRGVLVSTIVASLLVVTACGGSDPREDARRAAESARPAAESGTSGDTHSHEGTGQHSHEDAGAHTHTAVDTIASGVALDPRPDGRRWAGSVTLLAVGDSLRVLISVEGAPAGTRHGAELVAGSCREPGAELASLTPVVAGSSGKGSSQTSLPTGRVGDHAHGAVRLTGDDGSSEACAPVHLATSGHSHG